MLLKNKNAVIYGAGGAVGKAVARAFAREGATVFLAGRTLAKIHAVAEEILQEGGRAPAAQVDALDQNAITEHLNNIVESEGRLDIMFNLVGIEDIQGTPLVDMTEDTFSQPIAIAMKTQFLTATAAARHMIKTGSGVILFLTAQAGHIPYGNTGGFGVACAAIEALLRQLAKELGPQGIRTVCLRSSGSPDTEGVSDVLIKHAEHEGITQDSFIDEIVQRTALKRMPRVEEVANVAVLVASDRASAMTAAIANVTCGEIAD